MATEEDRFKEETTVSAEAHREVLARRTELLYSTVDGHLNLLIEKEEHSALKDVMAKDIRQKLLAL